MSPDEKAIREQLSGRRVLIIEDDVDLAPRLGDIFKLWGVKPNDIRHRRCVRGSNTVPLIFCARKLTHLTYLRGHHAPMGRRQSEDM